MPEAHSSFVARWCIILFFFYLPVSKTATAIISNCAFLHRPASSTIQPFDFCIMMLTLGFVSASAYVVPSMSNGFHWLVSAIIGIVVCRIVYKLTSIISSSRVTSYVKLSDAVKVEWNNRGFSTFHAVVVAFASLYLLLFSSTFDPGYSNPILINRTSTLSNTILGFSIGYFLSDSAMILWLYPALGGLEYVIHHGLSMFSIFLSLISGQGQIYILMVLFSESTTPFVNLRWYLDACGMKNSNIYTLNGIALFVGWLVARIILFILLFTHMALHFDQVKQIFPLGFYSVLVIPPILGVMNVFWFWKITKGLLKTLSKARHNQ